MYGIVVEKQTKRFQKDHPEVRLTEALYYFNEKPTEMFIKTKYTHYCPTTEDAKLRTIIQNQKRKTDKTKFKDLFE